MIDVLKLNGVQCVQSIERAFVADICRAPVSRGEMDQAALDRIIAAHLFQQVTVHRDMNCWIFCGGFLLWFAI